MTTSHFDAVIVGSGFGGLSTSILLARFGLRVALIEAERMPGGLLRSYKRAGVDCPVGVHYFGAAGKGELLGQFFDLLGVRDALKLRRMGESGIIDRYVFDDSTFELPSSLDAFSAALHRHFPTDTRAADAVVSALRSTTESLRLQPSGRPTGTAVGGAQLGASAGALFAEYGCPSGMRRILEMQSFLTGVSLDEAPVQFPLMSLASLLKSTWQLGCTGAEMADAFAERARSLGVQMIVGEPVTRVLVERNRASGVELASGDALLASSVVAGLHPKGLVDLVPEQHWPNGYADGIRALKETQGLFALVALLDERKHPPIPYNMYRIRSETRREGGGGYLQLRPSGIPGQTQLILMTPSAYEDWLPWVDTQRGVRGTEYEQRKRALGQRFLSMAEELVGPLHEPRIVDTWTPLTIRDWVHAPGGGAYGVVHSVHDLKYMALARTALPGLFMVGQSALACGLLGIALGVLRVAGEVAGRAAFRDFLARFLAEEALGGSP